MRAAQFDHFGPPEVIQVVEIDDLGEPGPHEVLVEVKAVSINRADIKSLSGWFPDIPFPRGLGREFAGAVRKVGKEVFNVTPGQMVVGVVQPSMQEWVLVPDTDVTPLPAGISYEIGACLPVAGQTAWRAVESQNVQPGDVCVVSGASGGVGSILVQLLVARGATVVAIARERHHEMLESMGALPMALGDNFMDDLREFTPQGIHHVFDQTGPVVIEAAIRLGVPHENINSISGFADFFGVPHVGRVGIDREVIEALCQMITNGELSIAIGTIYFDDVAKAFISAEIGGHFGKTVVSWTMPDYLLD